MLINDISTSLPYTEFNSNDLSNVKYRLNEQSHLIMALKDSADRELNQRHEFEARLALEADKVSELQEQVEELQLKLHQSQNYVTHLSEAIDRLTERTKKKSLSSDSQIQCHLDLEKITFEQGTNTDSSWMEDALKQTGVKMEYDKISTALRNLEVEKAYLEKQMMNMFAERRKSAAEFESATSFLEQKHMEAKMQIEKLQQKAVDNASQWSLEKAAVERQLSDALNKEEGLNRAIEHLQEENSTIKRQLEELRLLRRKEIHTYNINKQIKALNNELDESRIRYKNLQEVFTAYKQHTSELLQAEKNLNRKLRQNFH